ncbi:MAG: cytochrome c oxidase assembly protein [Henriciella sp.]|nr:cytochrome c oxidase assembly protein [Henriciella sp.]
MNNSRTALMLVGAALFMLGLAFASKPLYDTFCRVTGFGGTTQIADKAPEYVSDREISVRFDANVANAPLKFRATQNALPVQVGAHTLAFYEVTNTSVSDVNVIASYNVTPHKAGRFFNKLECFCFEERIIKAGETKKLPVIFFVDPAIEDERGTDDVRTITLSYTFFNTDEFKGAAKTASLD